MTGESEPEAMNMGAARAADAVEQLLKEVGSVEAALGSRRRARQVLVGGVSVGGDALVRVQSMTNTDTGDIAATVQQIALLARSGSELVRITVDRAAAARAVPHIVEAVRAQGITAPIVGDFHYNGHTLLHDEPACAAALDKFRINPGNVGFGDKRDRHFEAIVLKAMRHDKPIRIGVNWGSLDQRMAAQLMDANAGLRKPRAAAEVTAAAMVMSALRSAAAAVSYGLPQDRIVISAKVSAVPDLLVVYRALAARCDYPLHLGLTEAGMGVGGLVSSAAAMSILLGEGIGDTIRVSLTPEVGGGREQEVRAAQEILQSLGLRSFNPSVTACPGCGRTTSTYFQQLAADIEVHLAQRMPAWREQHEGVEELQVAVMGCIVNGPGESKRADIGISLPGSGESPVAPVFVRGKKVATLRGSGIAQRFTAMVDEFVATTYPKKHTSGAQRSAG